MPMADMNAATNALGLTRQDYAGARSTLCPGCGHDAITAQIIQAAWELALPPHRVAKFSGIGCSSKSPAYFLRHAWGFNSVHGRAASVCTGASLANRDLINLLVSGDGDSISIGLGQLAHAIRRNVPVVYILENNGVYGLTKGQFSATADLGSALKHGTVNEIPPIDPCGLAIELGCGFVARSFSGDPRQLNTILKAAFSHRGTAFIDVISPCVTFNNHDTSTRSYKNVKERDFPLHELGFVPPAALEEVEIPDGDTRTVDFPDGSRVVFRGIQRNHDPADRMGALAALHESRARGEFLTGILCLQPCRPTLLDLMHLSETPLAQLPAAALKPSPEVLEDILDALT